MGFRGLAPADVLGAFYDPVKQTLAVSASGDVRKYTYGYVFTLDKQWVGGLKFELWCWTGPLGTGEEKYEYSQDFKIALPNPVVSSGEIIVVTANHPVGERVPIHWGGLHRPPPQIKGDDAEPPTASIPQIVSTASATVNALFKEPFEIKAHSEVPKFGSVHITFDPTFLALQDAGIDDPNMVWTFNSLQTGNTQVIVTTRGGIASFVKQQIYDVRIFVLGRAFPDNDGIPLSFLGNVNLAVRAVTASYPDAELYEVEATLPRGTVNPTGSPAALSQLRVVFRAGKGTAIIKSTGWGEWGIPTYIDEPWMEDVVIPWPVKMEIDEAVKIMREKGYTGDFWNCTLRHPLGPAGKPNDEPYYIFGMADGRYVFVGVNDKAVVVNGVGQALLP